MGAFGICDRFLNNICCRTLSLTHRICPHPRHEPFHIETDSNNLHSNRPKDELMDISHLKSLLFIIHYSYFQVLSIKIVDITSVTLKMKLKSRKWQLWPVPSVPRLTYVVSQRLNFDWNRHISFHFLFFG